MRFGINQLLGAVACFGMACWIVGEAIILNPRPNFDFQALVTLILFAPFILALIGGGIGAILDHFKTLLCVGASFGFAIWVLLWVIVIRG